VLAVARATEAPTLLWTMSHGIGNANPRLQPGVQGQPRFVEDLTPALAGAGPFLPGGIWFLFACFGAATPSQSVYWHWLKLLVDANDPDLPAAEFYGARNYLPHPGAAPFVAAVPKAALANPEGPLAVLGHADLAWIYGYEDLSASGVDPRERFLRVPSLLADPSNRFRAGSAAGLFRSLGSIDASLSDLSDKEQEAAASGTAPTLDKLAYGRLWMQRQDLANYVLLGDPAVRLPIRGGGA
jgi:hypothetical protein